MLALWKWNWLTVCLFIYFFKLIQHHSSAVYMPYGTGGLATGSGLSAMPSTQRPRLGATESPSFA